MTATFSRLVALSKIGPGGLAVVVKASEAECAALAARMAIPAVRNLTCAWSLTPDEADPAIIEATGHLRGHLTRECIVSAEDFETAVEEHFTVLFVPAGTERECAGGTAQRRGRSAAVTPTPWNRRRLRRSAPEDR